MDRRQFLKNAAFTGMVWGQRSLPAAWAAQSAHRQPDILLIMPDQMRGDCLSCLGHPAVRTPHLDGLAARGVLFRRAYTTVASCILARFALLTGLSPQTSGVVGYAAKPITGPTLPGVLAENGYTTVLVGRYMHQLPESGDCGYQEQILGSTHVDDDAYDAYLTRQAPQTGGIRRLVQDMGLTYNLWQAKPWPLEERLHPTNWVVSQSRQVVRSAAPDRPLFLTTSFYAPHSPLFPPREYYDAYLDAPLPQAAHGDWVDWDALSPEGDRNGHRVRLAGATLRAAQAGYFGLIEHIDAQIGPLIREFVARSEQAGRPWIIVFTSDHGEMLGDHGYYRKCEPYEGSANVPFIVCGAPQLGFDAGRHINRPVCLEDIMPTLLSAAGVSCRDSVDGIDLNPVLRGGNQTIRPWLHFEHAPCYSQTQAFHALTDGRMKYIWRPTDGREQLFDLEQDPREEHDLSAEPSHDPMLRTWRTQLVQRLAPRPEGFVRDGELVPGRPYKALNDGVPPDQGA
ncbi:MAG TPA: arylsulfatase [Phycisphaerales bacterium]|nr:arylsulfatase [Phycisphaerales bacterium]